jgi:hypothetical protein
MERTHGRDERNAGFPGAKAVDGAAQGRDGAVDEEIAGHRDSDGLASGRIRALPAGGGDAGPYQSRFSPDQTTATEGLHAFVTKKMNQRVT